MLVTAVKTAANSVLRRCRADGGLLCLSAFPIAVTGERKHSYCTHTRTLLAFPLTTTQSTIHVSGINEANPLSQSLATAAFAGTSTTETAVSDLENTVNNNKENVAELVRQLQHLAARYTRHRLKENWVPFSESAANNVSEAAPVDVIPADEPNERSLMSKSTTEGSKMMEAAQPPWQIGLELAEKAGGARIPEVAEWLLFLCLRSQEDLLGSPAPLRVCEGLYKAWRQLRGGAAASTQAEQPFMNSQYEERRDIFHDPLDKSSHSSSLRSPFEPKGVHHYYATWLLKELHATRSLVQEVPRRTAEENAAADIGPKNAATAEYNEIKVLHRAFYLLNSALEVLLLDLPKDAAESLSGLRSATQQYHKQYRRHLHSVSLRLRPTTALLVLEASRQLALLRIVRRRSIDDGSLFEHYTATAAFPLLSFLLTPKVSVNGGKGENEANSTGSTEPPLHAVAKAAFEIVLRTAPPTSNAVTGASMPHCLKSDAIILYLGFLMAFSPLPSLVAEDVNCFVCKGSLTACQLSGQASQNTVAGTEQDESTTAVLTQSHITEAVAAAVRVLLAAYLDENGSSTPCSCATSSSEERSAHRAVASAFAAALLQPSPAGLQTLFELQHREEFEVNHPKDPDSHESSGGNRSHLSHLRKQMRPVSWCAWLLRVLLCDLERAGGFTATQPRTLDNLRNSPAHSTNETFAKNAWKRQSEWVLSLTTRLIMQLQQQQHRRVPTTPRHQGQTRFASAALRRPLQEVWRLVFQAALQGSFFHHTSSSELFFSERSKRSSASGQRSKYHQQHYPISLRASANASPILFQLCYPYYDKSQWRGQSVNLYLRLLDQWGQGQQVRQIFATVAQRESDYQAQVLAAVTTEQATAATSFAEADRKAEIEGDDSEQAEGDMPAVRSSGTSNSCNDVFRRYRPALSLYSCTIALKYCGCPLKVLTPLTNVDSLSPRSRAYRTALNVQEDNDIALTSLSRSNTHAAARARLAGQVLQYIVCFLHVAERKAFHAALLSDGNSGSGSVTLVSEKDKGDDDDDLKINVANTFTVEGYPVMHWVEWVGGCCVPAVEELYRDAGLEEEWSALGY